MTQERVQALQTGVVMSSDLRKFGRLDASFLLLAGKHIDLVDELMATFTREELIELAKAMPYDRTAIQVIMRSTFRTPCEADGVAAVLSKKPYKDTDIAVYVAVAAQHAASKILTKMSHLTEQKQAELEGLLALLRKASDKKAKRLAKALKGDLGKNKENPLSVLPLPEMGADYCI